MRPVAIFRFSPTEGPGYLGEWLEAHALPPQVIALDQGASVPRDPRAFSGIVMMGGHDAQSQTFRASEAAIRGFWKKYRALMGA